MSLFFKAALIINIITGSGVHTISIPMENYDLCEKEKPRIVAELKMERSSVSASCTMTHK